MVDIKSYFEKNCYDLDEKAIYSLDKQDNGPINNVIVNLNEHCYGVHIYEDKEFIEYLLFYIDNRNGLSGIGLLNSLKLDIKTRTTVTIEFCKLVNEKYPHADIVDIFNTLQTYSRSTFEKLGFFTFGNEIRNLVDSYNFVGLVSGKRGVIAFPTMEKIELYRWFFNEDADFVQVDQSRKKKIYLLLDSKNNLIKIGQSYTPDLREKTLQGVAPNWDLITTWIAPIIEEKKLHKMFEDKRSRGEWFDLDFTDLKKIKKYMNKYKNCL
jgi:hypothetical protein